MSSGGRKSLVWDIRKSLLTLTAEELLRVARAVNPVSDVDQSELVERDQEECYDCINSFMYSKQLLETEDEGMVQLLMLKDTIDDIVKCCDDMSFQNVKGDSELHTGQSGDKFDDLADFAEGSVTIRTPPEITTDTHPQSRHTPTLISTTLPSDIAEPDSGSVEVTMLNVPDTSNADLLKVLASYEELSKKLIQCMPAHASPSQTHMPSSSVLSKQLDRNPPEVLICGQPERLVSVLASLLSNAISVPREPAEALVNFIQTAKPVMQQGRLRTGAKDIVLPAGQVLWVRCRVPSNMDASTRLVLFETDEDSLPSGQWDAWPGLVEIQNPIKPHVTIPIGNNTNHDITIPRKTALGNLQCVENVVEADTLDKSQPAATVSQVTTSQRQKQPQQRVNSADKDGISDTDDEDEWTGGYWLRTPVVRMGNDQAGHDTSVSSAREQSPVSKSSSTTVPGLTPKKPTMTYKECPGTLLTRETKLMDAYLPDGRETPERDNTHTGETNLPESEPEQDTPEKEDKQSLTDRDVELVGEESQTSEQSDVTYLPQPGEDGRNEHAEQVREERLSYPPMMTGPAEETHRETYAAFQATRNPCFSNLLPVKVHWNSSQSRDFPPVNSY
ncbi:hypothetical protein DPX16_21864 [Anabarilius grahami]|uniref:Uncharacterized protein n=1 Tax=Anabarilius grahami TaxID=495550 RepID=A0A3N0YBS8_ANAGA|nr:hypothetical protein DPX16_21864 [Anabarilius grahami]